jgi:hypothetical protein
MKPARHVLNWLYALLLLVAQQGALTHSVWHLHDHLPAHGQQQAADTASSHGGNEPSSQSRLCDLHSVLGTLLAGDCGGQTVLAAPALSHGLTASAATWRFAQTATTPPSRAPPAHS